MKISLCMIVKDEEEVLSRCLESAAPLVDEIVILDTGSCDRTKEIARGFTPLVYDFAWQDDFALARNASFEKAGGDFRMWLDADDVILPEEAKKFPSVRETLEEEPDMVLCPYATGGMKFYRERILRKGHGVWQGRVHECIPPHGKTVRSDFTVTHLGSTKDRKARNLEIYRKWAAEEPLSGRDLFYYGRELYYHKLYTEAEAVLEKMLAGEGWYVNRIEACRVLAACHAECNEKDSALLSLFRSFCYGEPRAAVLCDIGKLMKEQGRFREAVYWYEAAKNAADHTAEGDFELPECRGILPLLELVYLYHVLGDHVRSAEYHRICEQLAPDHPSVKYNRGFFGF